MEWSNFTIHNVPADGDCFFKSLEIALRTIGLDYSIRDLRHHVAKRVLNPNDVEMNNIIQFWCETFKDALKEKNELIQQEYSHVACICPLQNLDILSRRKLYESMMSKFYWAEEIAIRTLERALRLRCLIYDQETQTGFAPTTQHESFPHDIYILLHFQGNHYSPISYQDRMVFLKEMLPNPIKYTFRAFL